MKHQGLKPGAAIVRGGKRTLNTETKTIIQKPVCKVEARPSVSSVSQTPAMHLLMADETEKIIDNAYDSLMEITDKTEIDAIISTIISSLKNMYYKTVNRNNQYATADELFNIEIVSQSFLTISYVVKIMIYRRSLAKRYDTMMRTNCKFIFSAVNMDGTAEELSFMTVLEHIIDKFVKTA